MDSVIRKMGSQGNFINVTEGEARDGEVKGRLKREDEKQRQEKIS